MGRYRIAGVAVAAALAGLSVARGAPAQGPTYTPDGRMLLPADYRSWIFLSSGMDMSYLERAGPANASVFDNVFVDPKAWSAFQRTGTWPDKTVMVLEARQGQQNGSINKHGRFQTGVMAREIHVKDVNRFKGGWAFFSFNGEGPGQLLPQSAPCYACHRDHAAVDTTFVQFYPTLLPIAERLRTLSAAYLAEEGKAAAKP